MKLRLKLSSDFLINTFSIKLFLSILFYQKFWKSEWREHLSLYIPSTFHWGECSKKNHLPKNCFSRFFFFNFFQFLFLINWVEEKISETDCSVWKCCQNSFSKKKKSTFSRTSIDKKYFHFSREFSQNGGGCLKAGDPCL